MQNLNNNNSNGNNNNVLSNIDQSDILKLKMLAEQQLKQKYQEHCRAMAQQYQQQIEEQRQSFNLLQSLFSGNNNNNNNNNHNNQLNHNQLNHNQLPLIQTGQPQQLTILTPNGLLTLPSNTLSFQPQQIPIQTINNTTPHHINNSHTPNNNNNNGNNNNNNIAPPNTLSSNNNTTGHVNTNPALSPPTITNIANIANITNINAGPGMAPMTYVPIPMPQTITLPSAPLPQLTKSRSGSPQPIQPMVKKDVHLPITTDVNVNATSSVNSSSASIPSVSGPPLFQLPLPVLSNFASANSLSTCNTSSPGNGVNKTPSSIPKNTTTVNGSNIEFIKLSNVTSSNTTNTTTTNNNSSSNNNLQGKENKNTIFNMNMDIKHGIVNASTSSDITHNKINNNVNHNNTNNVAPNNSMNIDDINDHIKDERRKYYRCNGCNKKYLDKTDLANHLNQIDMKKPYKCKFCCKSFSRLGNLNNHVRIHNKSNSPQNPKELTTTNSIDTHSLSTSTSNTGHHHSNHRNSSTSTRNNRHSNNNNNSNHSNRTQRSSSRNSKKRTGSDRERDRDRDNTMVSARSTSKLSCDNIIMSKNNRMKIDQLNDCTNKPFKCDECNKSFRNKSGLSNHKIIHNGMKPHKCTFSGCGKAFARSCDLTRHIRLHTGDKPFKCHYKNCGKSFTRSVQLRLHMMDHTGKRPFHCHICKKGFKTLQNSQIHMRIHTGEKPYQCKYCHKKFTQSSSLRTHLSSIH